MSTACAVQSLVCGCDDSAAWIKMCPCVLDSRCSQLQTDAKPQSADEDDSEPDSGADDSDVEEAEESSNLTSLFTRVHLKKVAWRTVRDVIIDTHVFDVVRNPSLADQDSTSGTTTPPSARFTIVVLFGCFPELFVLLLHVIDHMSSCSV
jgi:hypothetical protein